MFKQKIKHWFQTRKRKKKFATFYSQFIKAGDLCFDIGANFGDRTEIFLGLGANVISVEPVTECLEILHKKFDKNKDVRIIPIALSSKKGQTEIHISNYLEVCTMSDKFMKAYKGQKGLDINWHSTRSVKTNTLDALIEEYGKPVFCKIDVEGHEKEVLKGLALPIPYMSFEYNAKLKNLALECLHILSKFNGLQFNFSPYESMEFSLNNWMDEKAFYIYIETLPNAILTGDIYVKSI